MFACLNKKVSHERVEEEELRVTKAVYIDELSNYKKKLSPPPCKAVKKSVRFADSEPCVFGEENNEKNFVNGGNIRVKIKMTKEEAARLLSKCKEGGVLEFKDVARELVALPMNRVSVVSASHEQQ